MKRQLPGEPRKVGDVKDVEALVRKVASSIVGLSADERDDVIAEGLRLMYLEELKLKPGESLAAKVGGRVSTAGGSWLRCRLLNFVKAQRHPLETATEGEDLTELVDARRESENAEDVALRNVTLSIFNGEHQVHDSRVTARYLRELNLYSGASHRPAGTAIGKETWVLIDDDRNELNPGRGKFIY